MLFLRASLWHSWLKRKQKQEANNRSKAWLGRKCIALAFICLLSFLAHGSRQLRWLFCLYNERFTLFVQVTGCVVFRILRSRLPFFTLLVSVYHIDSRRFTDPSNCLSVRPSSRLSVRPSICPSVCPSVRPSVHLSVSPSVRQSVHLAFLKNRESK